MRYFVFPGNGSLNSDGGYNYGYAAPAGGPVDYPVTVSNSGGAPARIESAALIPVPGFGVPVLRHVAFSSEYLDIAVYRSWPPKIASGDPRTHIVGLSKVLVTDRHQEILLVSIVAPHRGDYGFAGLAVRYEEGGSQYVSKLWDSGELCAGDGSCFDKSDRFGNAVAAVQGGG